MGLPIGFGTVTLTDTQTEKQSIAEVYGVKLDELKARMRYFKTSRSIS